MSIGVSVTFSHPEIRRPHFKTPSSLLLYIQFLVLLFSYTDRVARGFDLRLFTRSQVYSVRTDREVVSDMSFESSY